jgi:hypothetical protein
MRLPDRKSILAQNTRNLVDIADGNLYGKYQFTKVQCPYD